MRAHLFRTGQPRQLLRQLIRGVAHALLALPILVGAAQFVAHPVHLAGQLAVATVHLLEAFGPFDGAPRLGEQLLRGERFGQVVVGAALEPLQARFRIGECRDHDDRQVRVVRLAANRLADVVAAAPRQLDVQEHQVRLFLERNLECVLAVVGGQDAVAVCSESDLQEFNDARIVVHHENRVAGAVPGRGLRTGCHALRLA